MAAKKSTRASRTGRPIHRSRKPKPAKRLDIDQLFDILGAFDEGIGVLRVTFLAMEGARADIVKDLPHSLAPYAITLQQGLTLVSAAHRRFDQAVGALNPRKGKHPAPGSL